MSSVQQNSIQQNIYPYLQLILRRKWIILLGALPVLIAGLIYCLVTPLTYKASALIVVVPQKVPETYIRSTVTGRNDERIRGILQEIMSRTTLEKLIKKYNLYPELRKKFPMEVVVEHMKKDLLVENPRDARKNAFRISFQSESPELAAKIANAFANIFVEYNLKLRESQSANTAKFLSEQLNKIYAELKKREERLKRYKIEHMGELPEQRQSNLATLAALQRQLQDIQENIRRAEDRRLLLRQQISDQITSLNIASAQHGTTKGESSNNQALTLPELKERLRLLLSRYTENHPDVIALKKAIEKQERELRKFHQKSGGASGSSIDLTGNPTLDALKLQLRSTDFEIAQLKQEKVKVEQQIQLYQKRIENTPKREQELIDLTRDYENLKKTYDDLLQKKLAAEQAAALERHQQGEQFRIVDPARIPERPVKPDIKKLLPLIFVVAFGFSGGLAFAVDMLSNKYYDPEEVKSDLGLEVLACIPQLLSPEELRRKKLRLIGLICLTGLGYLIVVSLLAILIVKGPGCFSDLLV
ncbi:MAG: hypothetical protein GXO58_09965 [Thermodesulfobacteria bacterium]|nr:hypothetical protein [Thermodesulfobacteriota bacterium]